MVTNFITPDGDDDMNISYVNSNKTTSLPVELDALNNKDISYAKDFFLYIETQLKIAKDFCRPGEEVSSSIASKVFHAFIDLVNKIRGKKDSYDLCQILSPKRPYAAPGASLYRGLKNLKQSDCILDFTNSYSGILAP